MNPAFLLERGRDGFDVRSLAVTFRSGARLSRHSHRWAQLIYARSGVMHVETDARWWLVPPTKAIWVPPGLAHQIGIRGEVAMRTLYLSPDLAQSLSPDARALEVAPLLRELVLYILQIGMLHTARGDHARLSGVLVDLIGQARSQDLDLPLPQDRRALALARHLHAQPDDGRTLTALAAEVGATLRTLQRVFPLETGLTVRAWRQKSRLIYAMASLASGSSVSQAAFDCGYQSVSAFTSAFSRQFGATPGRHGAF